MSDLVDAILPLILLGAFGWGLRLVGFLDAARRTALESMVYYALIPPLMIHALTRTPIELAVVAPLAVVVLVPIGLVMLVVFALRALAPASTFWLNGPGLPPTIMGVTRNNIFLVLAASQALLGDAAAALVAIAAMIYVPTVNVIGVVACMRYGTAERTAMWATVRALSSNPLILGTLAGLVLNVTGIGLPGPLEPAAGLLSASTLPLAIVCVGAGLTLPAVRAAPLGLVVNAALKLVAMPLMGFAVCVWLEVPDELALAVILYHTGPTAAGGYILAKQLGGDAYYMAAIITTQTLAAALTMPLVFGLLSGFYA